MIIKSTLSILALCFCFVCNAQRTITVEQAGYYIENEIDFPEDIDRVIDSNDVLTPFVGRWSGVFNGKSYFFEIVKNPETNPYSLVTTTDRLRIAYNISDGAGNVLFDSTAVPYSSMGGRFLNTKNHYYLTVADSCGFDATVVIIPDYTGQSNTGLTLNTGYNKLLVYLYITPELRYEIPTNCVGIQELFPIQTLFLLNKIP